MKDYKYPRITTIWSDNHHDNLEVSYTLDEAPIVCCGDSGCTVICNLPALVITTEYAELKAHSNSVACGPIFSNFRVEWKGSKVEVPNECREYLLSRWWL